jgi:hypothetical protein
MIIMAWGIEFLEGFDAFHFGADAIINGFFIMLVFSYVSRRGYTDKPFEEALEILGATYFVAFCLSIFGFPPLIVAIGLVIAYSLIQKFMFKTEFRPWLVSFVSLWIVFGMICLLDASVRNIFTWGVSILYFFLMGEISTRKKAKEKASEKPKK